MFDLWRSSLGHPRHLWALCGRVRNPLARTRETSTRSLAISLGIAALAVAVLSPSAQAARTDVVILRNADHITGEIKSLAGGRLEYKTDDMDRIYIEWEKIQHVTSADRFEVIDEHGIKRYGSIGRTEKPYEVVITTPVAPDTMDLHRIVRITPIKLGFWKRLKGSISAGFSYTSATETSEFNLGGGTSSRTEKYNRKLDYSIYVTDQTEKRTSRYSAGLTVDRFLGRRWTAGLGFSGEHNEELGLDLRLSLTLAGTRYLLETNKSLLRFSLGLSGNQERYIDTDSTAYNLEIPIVAEYRRFTFNNPESDIGLSGTIYPSLTTGGRYRGSLDADLNHEIYKDLFFVIGFYYDYDSKPPTGGATDDYRLTTSIKWTYN